MGKQAVKKLAGHPDLIPGEEVKEACWGAGAAMMKVARWTNIDRPQHSDIEEVVGKGGGRADVIASNGIMALTDRRLLWCPVKTKVGKPEKLFGFEFDEIAELRFDKPVLVVEFKDGSSGGIRTDFTARPGDLMKAWESIRPRGS
jgi:hypothetical protein